jgi:phospholipid/cholesterol/gamma-HCH transport system substrate-binding protein
VISVDFAGEGSGGLVEVVMRLERRVSSRVTTDSEATLGSLGLLGEKAVDISVSLTGIPISHDGYIRAAAEDPFRGLLSDASDSTAHIKRILARMDAGEGLVGRALRDEELFARMLDVSVRLQEAMSKIESSEGPLGRLMNDQEMSDRFASSARAVETVLTRIESGEGALGVLSKDEALVAQLRELTANLQKSSASVQRGEGTLGKLLHDDALYSRMAEVSVHLESTLGRLERGEGTAGRLLRDTELYNNLNGTLADIRGLVTDVRRDPNKYLRVKVSLF